MSGSPIPSRLSPRIRPIRGWLPAIAVVCWALTGADGPSGFSPKPKLAGDLPLVLKDDFERDDSAGWEFTDPSAWKITRAEGGRVLDQHKVSQYSPAVRSPLNIALAKGLDVGDFVMDLKVHSTTRDYPHRDLCLFFGHQDPSHFYYVHLGKQADPHANSIFLVDGKPRVSIAETRTEGTPWTDRWHHVRLVRTVKNGLIQVYFDDMDKPAMTAHDKTFTHGRLGVGSFDDTGQFDDLQVWGERVKW
jgi:hypothetical protein